MNIVEKYGGTSVGTIEQRIDWMIRDKQKLAGSLLESGVESQLMKMTPAELLRFEGKPSWGAAFPQEGSFQNCALFHFLCGTLVCDSGAAAYRGEFRAAADDGGDSAGFELRRKFPAFHNACFRDDLQCFALRFPGFRWRDERGSRRDRSRGGA